MTPITNLPAIGPLDAVALALLLTGWIVIGWWIEREKASRPSVTVITAQFRRDWMREMVNRDPRIFDAQLVASLRQGTAFFASTCVIGIGGVLALIGNTERLVDVAEDLTMAGIPSIVWEMKLALVGLLLTNAFLKFAWSNRLFGYCAVMMGAVPNDPAHPLAMLRADQAGELNIRAAWNFNRGLRAMYFSLAALAWLLGAVPLIAATLLTLWVVWSREFWSQSRDVLLTRPTTQP